MVTETIYSGRDGASILILQQRQLGGQQAPVDLTPITRMALEMPGGVVIDSDVSPAVFDWAVGSVPTTDPDCGKLILMLGTAGLAVGREYGGCRLIVYDPSNPNGVVWADDLKIIVR